MRWGRVMKAIFKIGALFAVTFIIGLWTVTANAATPADPNASPTTRTVLNYLSSLPGKADHKLISGQWGNVDWQPQAIYAATGQWVGLLGGTYYDPSGLRQNASSVNPSFINHWNKGGLVQIDNHFLNPQTGGNSWDTNINFTNLITPGTATYNNFMNQLDIVAAGLQELENAGVVVLFRPFHEMTGGWFWWSKGGTDGYKKLWIQTFNYLTYTKGLHNLLWVYSTYAAGPQLGFYPGAQYVDIVGADIYGYGGGKLSGYDELLTTGKPYAITEFGLQSAANTQRDPKDLSAAIQKIIQAMPKAIYVLNWASHWAIQNQLNASEALNNPGVQNRPVPYGSAPTPPTDTTAPNIPGGLTAIAASSSQINLSWNAVSDNVGGSGIAGYKIYRNGGTTPVATTNGTGTTYANTGLAANTAYSYTVAAYDAAGNTSTKSASVSKTTPATTTPLPDVIVTALSYANGVFTAVVKNIGTAATPSGVAIGVGFFVNDAPKTTGSVSGALAVGAEVTVKNTTVASLANGSYTIKAQADNTNLISESNEANNTHIQPLTVGAPTPTICPTPANANTYSASADFSGVQGCRQWSYRDSAGANMTFDAVSKQWKGSEQYLLLWNAGGHPGNGPDAVRRWTAPAAGSIRITGRASDVGGTAGTDGVKVSIRKGTATLWENTLANGNTTGVAYDLTTTVAAGNTIDFVINKLSNNGSDSTSFNPTIVLSTTTTVPAPPPTTATTTTLVNFGSSATSNTFGLSGWGTVIKDAYTYYSSAGSAGTLVGSNGGYNFQGVKGTARTFAAGNKIIVTWYNNSAAARTFTPKLSTTNPGRFWPGGYSMSTVTVPANGTATSTYTFTTTTAGSYSLVNVNGNIDYTTGLICDKIVLVTP